MYTDLRPHTLPHRSPPSHHQPSPPSRRRLSPPRGLCRHRPAELCRHRPAGLCRHPRRHLRFSSTYHLFHVLHIRHVGRKIVQCSPNKDGGCRFEYTAYTGNFEKSLLLTRTLAARCPNAKFVHKNSLCFMETIIFQLLSCLYLYDSGMLRPVCIRKQMLYSVFRRLAVIHRAAGIPTSGACGNIPCRRYTAFWRRMEVCAKSVYRLLASKGLTWQKEVWRKTVQVNRRRHRLRTSP